MVELLWILSLKTCGAKISTKSDAAEAVWPDGKDLNGEELGVPTIISHQFVNLEKSFN